MADRLVVKGTILTYDEKFIVGEDVFSSIKLITSQFRITA